MEERGGAVWVDVVTPTKRHSAQHHLAREAAGAPLPLRCNMRAIELRLVRLLQRGVVIDVHVGCTKPQAKCNKRVIAVHLECPILEEVAIDELVGSPLPKAR